MRKVLIGWLLVTAFWPLAAQVRVKTPPAKSSDTVGAKVVTRVLERGYLLAAQLSPEERATALRELTRVASSRAPKVAGPWAEELLSIAEGLAPEDRSRSQFAAVSAIARINPEKALGMIRRIEPLPRDERDANRVPPNLRRQAAGIALQKLAEKGMKALPEVRDAVERLAEADAVPYSMLGSILQQASKSPEQAQAIYRAALSSFQVLRPEMEATRSFFFMLRSSSSSLPREEVAQGYRRVAANLLQLANESTQTQAAQIVTERGMTQFRNPAERMLFELLPLVSDELASDILRQRPELAQAQQLATGAQQRRMSPPGGRWGGDAVDQAARAARRDPETALTMAERSNDPLQRTVVMAQAAGGLGEDDPTRAAKLLDQANQLSTSIEDKRGQLRAALSTAQAAQGLERSAVLRDSLQRGFDLANQLLREEYDKQPEQHGLGETYRTLSRLMQVAARSDADWALAQVEQLAYPLPKAMLMARLAESMPMKGSPEGPSNGMARRRDSSRRTPQQ